MAHEIFISYRREDTRHAALALEAQLCRVFGDGAVFLDQKWIMAGEDWRESLHRALAGTRVVLALIGPKWLRAADEWGRRRLDERTDWVRIELATALEKGITVIPLMLEGALPPNGPPLPYRLPAALAQLNFTQVRVLNDNSWMDNFHGLVDLLRSGYGLGPGDDGSRRPAAATAPLGAPPAPQVRLPALCDADAAQCLRDAGLAHWDIDHQAHPWVVVGTAQELTRSYGFRSFHAAVDFMAVAARHLSGPPVHHPRWQNQWKTVQVWFSTWDVGSRITRMDIDAARNMDRLYDDYVGGRLPPPGVADGA